MISVSNPPGPVKGTATNDDAAAGYVGEYVSSTVLVGSGISLTSVTPADITSLSLTAGDWDVWANYDFSAGASTDITQLLGWTSTTSATVPTVPNGGAFTGLNYGAGTHVGVNDHFPISTKRYSLSGTTTVYLSTRCTFTVSTLTAYGFIGARRVR